jgi:hypothetical protein
MRGVHTSVSIVVVQYFKPCFLCSQRIWFLLFVHQSVTNSRCVVSGSGASYSQFADKVWQCYTVNCSLQPIHTYLHYWRLVHTCAHCFAKQIGQLAVFTVELRHNNDESWHASYHTLY